MLEQLARMRRLVRFQRVVWWRQGLPNFNLDTSI